MLKCYINIARCELNFWEVLFLVAVQISLNSVVESSSNKNHSKFSQCQQFVLLSVSIMWLANNHFFVSGGKICWYCRQLQILSLMKSGLATVHIVKEYWIQFQGGERSVNCCTAGKYVSGANQDGSSDDF